MIPLAKTDEIFAAYGLSMLFEFEFSVKMSQIPLKVDPADDIDIFIA